MNDEIRLKSCELSGCLNAALVDHVGIGICTMHNVFLSQKREVRDQQIALEARNDLLFDLDEIENKPWRVFRQLAEIMPDYAGIYTEYQAFYSYGGGREVKKLIEEFKKTDDYKDSGYPERLATLKAKQEEDTPNGN
jgi:hypothetical protein